MADDRALRQLHARIRVTEDPANQRVYNRIQERLNRLQDPGAQARERAEGARADKSRQEAEVNRRRQIARQVAALRRQAERYRVISERINRGLVDRRVRLLGHRAILEKLEQIQRRITVAAGRTGTVDKARYRVLRAQEKVLFSMLKRQRQLTAEVQRAQTAGRQGGLVGTLMSMARGMRMVMSVYWTTISGFYLLRNLLRVIGDAFRFIGQWAKVAATAIGGFVVYVTNAASEMEMLSARMGVMFRALAPKVKRWIMEEAIGLPFTWVDIGRAITRAVVMGIKDFARMKEVVRVGEDLAIAFGKPLERGVQAIMQGAVGRFRSLIETFGFRPELAVKYGAVPRKQGQGVAGGMENLQRNVTAILKMISDRVGGAADAMRMTWTAIVRDMEDLVARLIWEIRDDVVNPLKVVLFTLRELFLPGGGGQGIAPWGQAIVEYIKAIWGIVREFALEIARLLPRGIALLVSTMEMMTYWLAKVYKDAGGAKKILQNLYDRFIEWVPSLLRLLAGIGEALAKVLVWITATGGRYAMYQTERQAAYRRYEERVREIHGIAPGEQIPMRQYESHRTPEQRQAIRERELEMQEAYTRWRESAKLQGRISRGIEDAADAVRAAADVIEREGAGPFGEAYRKHLQKMPSVRTPEQVLADMLAAGQEFAGAAKEAGEGFEASVDRAGKKITNIFDVGRFMGYTTLATRHGYGAPQATAMAQARVMREMAGKPRGPWPWQAQQPVQQQTTLGAGGVMSPMGRGWGPGYGSRILTEQEATEHQTRRGELMRGLWGDISKMRAIVEMEKRRANQRAAEGGWRQPFPGSGAGSVGAAGPGYFPVVGTPDIVGAGAFPAGSTIITVGNITVRPGPGETAGAAVARAIDEALARENRAARRDAMLQ